MKYWHPDIPRFQRMAQQLVAPNVGLVLDIGGNKSYRFPAATKTVGWEGDIKLNLSHDRLPFEDQSVGFVFCRHTLEDMADPHHLLSEIRRVARAGYIETPSPLAELTRGVDAAGDHLGYVHHRWVCYKDFYRFVGAFTMLAKYPIAERMPLPDSWNLLHDNPPMWNTCYSFTGPLEFRVIEQEQGLELAHLDERGVRDGYLSHLGFAIRCSHKEHSL